MDRFYVGHGIFVPLLLAAASASAQSPDPTAAAEKVTVTIPEVLGTSASLPGQPPKQWQPLADKGVRFVLSYVGEAAANETGGTRHGSAFAGQLLFGADLDLTRIVGLDGGTLHFAVTNRHGESLSARILGNNTSVQEIYGYMGTRLAVLSYDQKLFNDKIDLEFGKSDANSRYLVSPIYCNFQTNAVCGNPTFAFKNSNYTGFPASTWMVNLSARLGERVAFQTGAYEVNPYRTRPNDNDFSFSLKHATGAFIPYELTYGTSAANDRLPRHYTFGGWFDTGDYNDPLRDAQGGVARVTGRSPAVHAGRSAVYFRFDQTIVKPDPRSPRGLAVFGAALLNIDGRVSETNMFELGLLQTGTVKGRDQDTLGFVVSDQRFSNLLLESLRAARASVGGTQPIQRHQYMFELAYGAQLANGLRVSPNIQYIVHPDPSGLPPRRTSLGDALIFGFKFAVDLPTLAGGFER